MLRLEKNSSSQLPNLIYFEERENFFSKRLLLAFSIAFTFHTAFLLIFKISNLHFPWDEKVFTPMEVHVEPIISSHFITAELDPAGELLDYLPLPIPLLPQYVSISFVDNAQPLENIKDKDVMRNFFSSIEKEVYQVELTPFSISQEPLRIIISGTLAEKKLVSKLPEIEHALKKQHARLTYSVYLEERSGTIFWFELKQSSDRELVRLAENILKNMKFSASSLGGIVDGEIEFNFNLGR